MAVLTIVVLCEVWQVSVQEALHLPYRIKTAHRQDCAVSSLLAEEASAGYAC